MTRLLPAALLALLAVPAQAATCLINIEGMTIFDGPCAFTSTGGDGSFRIVSADGWSVAELGIIEPGVAQAWWNETNGTAHASAPLGTLYRDIRDPACWVNGTATVCAW